MDAGSIAMPGTEQHALILATQELTLAEISEAASLAKNLGVHLNTIYLSFNFGFPELAVCADGFGVE